ncbi:hypothetical protein E4U16_007408 [Claviceps sp. LM84 group G4]|nr:hypothetical protein E4U33_007887 [Claviceps sp. LM78 group G4]KAG6081462.1 hypothetical protein E4U16_007408 [Claviceps sp. LM84 group G4]
MRKLHVAFVCQSTPVAVLPIVELNKKLLRFNGAIGAIYGTHIPAFVYIQKQKTGSAILMTGLRESEVLRAFVARSGGTKRGVKTKPRTTLVEGILWHSEEQSETERRELRVQRDEVRRLAASKKRLSYFFESGAALEWSDVAFLNHLEVLYSDTTTAKIARLELQRLRQAPDEPFSNYLVRFEAKMARAHRLDAPEDEKAALLHQSISRELDTLCRYYVIPTHSYAEAVAVFKHQEAEQRAFVM